MKKKRIKKKKTNYFAICMFVVAVALIIFIFISTFKQKTYTFDEAVKKISQIDSRHNISFSDYEKGLFYLRAKPRYPNPFNVAEMQEVLEEYSAIVGDRAANLFVDFRKNLLEAEMHYRLSYKRWEGDIQNNPLQCKNKGYIAESIAHQNSSIKKINAMLINVTELKVNYPNEFSKLNISEKWIKLMNDTITDFNGDITYKLDFYNRFCLNKTGPIN